MEAKKLIGGLVEFLIGAVVLIYLGLHTINFFMFTFPPDQQYLAWLGFGLTGGAFIGYLIVFMWMADSPLKKTVALLMMLVSGIGEIAAAGFGMTIEAWTRMGWTMTQQDFDMMLLVIRALAFAHALALAVYVAGDKIGELLGDHDRDGIINALDPDYRVYAKDAKQPKAIKQVTIPENVYKQLLIDAGVGNGHKAKEDADAADAPFPYNK